MTRSSKMPAIAAGLMLGIGSSLWLTACDKPTETAAPAAATTPVSQPRQRVWADFGSGNMEMPGGVKAGQGWYAEDKRDVSFQRLEFDKGGVRLIGNTYSRHGSRYAGITLSMNSSQDGGEDVSAFSVLHLELASAEPNHVLQVRLIGPDDSAKFRGCYPYVEVRPSTDISEHNISLVSTLFPALAWCKDLPLDFATTLKGLRAVEIIDPTMPAAGADQSAIDFSVKTVRFSR